ncbi:MAG TPA: putative quinol monooxygenase [Caulobacteraceae bacterium]|nr:putative quinol monooxygenase [Caulobacteraceae bacterium]
MIAIVATLKIRDGTNAEFEAASRAHMANVKANEPGNLGYTFAKSRSDPNTYKVLELYKDDAALTAHREARHQRDFGGKVGPLFAGRPEIELFDAI